MMKALWVAKTGLDAQNTRMSVVSNNLANANTTGFKQDRAVFEDLLYQTVRQPGGATTQQSDMPTGMMLGTGVRVAATEKNHAQGNMQQTGNALDVAVDGRGYFEIQLADGSIAYTRDGSFKLSAQGELVTAQGFLLQPPVNIPEGAQTVTIAADGTVSAKMADQAQPLEVGRLTLTDFVNPAGLQPRGGNLYAETAASGPPQQGTPGLDGLGSLVQGSLEASNVNIVEELVSMIETQRAYEMNSKAVSAADEMLRFVNQQL
ncbi:flagellar basal-body rod protein FlgG [Algiphilus sp.]|uniref:flagellar basal-body rod protein FlgG n=1 Tax=Algiphilus sp. TaxID=1872431 RepID=UPI0025BD066A|nr:flagellar basal-body rod protein FlgG [Algiphilus sp.]MCK5771370.1 flagellar basal-body rod protein FlgG [Algiphilus sp.]